jgi:hypothetical protein
MKKIIPILIMIMIPVITAAQVGVTISIGGGGVNTIEGIVWFFIDVLNNLIPLLIGLAVLLFIWGLFRYFSTDSRDTKKQALRIIGYGIVSIFVMVSLWGIVYLIGRTIGINNNGGTILPPTNLPKELPRLDTEVIKTQP